jgi:hypothetical protein
MTLQRKESLLARVRSRLVPSNASDHASDNLRLRYQHAAKFQYMALSQVCHREDLVTAGARQLLAPVQLGLRPANASDHLRPSEDGIPW